MQFELRYTYNSERLALQGVHDLMAVGLTRKPVVAFIPFPLGVQSFYAINARISLSDGGDAQQAP